MIVWGVGFAHAFVAMPMAVAAKQADKFCRACYGVLRFIMESGAKGCEVIVSGKLRAQRAKAMKFKDGYMISSGQPVNDYIDGAVRHVMLRQGVLGIKVRRRADASQNLLAADACALCRPPSLVAMVNFLGWRPAGTSPQVSPDSPQGGVSFFDQVIN